MGLYIALMAFMGFHIADAEGHDFFLQAHFHAQEWIFIRIGFFPFKISATGKRFEGGEDRVYARARSRDRAVHAFSRKQDRAPDAMLLRAVQQPRLMLGETGQGGEFIKGGDDNFGHGGVLSHERACLN